MDDGGRRSVTFSGRPREERVTLVMSATSTCSVDSTFLMTSVSWVSFADTVHARNANKAHSGTATARTTWPGSWLLDSVTQPNAAAAATSAAWTAISDDAVRQRCPPGPFADGNAKLVSHAHLSKC